MGAEETKIKNKMLRQQIFADLKDQKNKQRHKMRAQRAKEEKEDPNAKEKRLKENVPKTIEGMRVYDETIGQKDEADEEDLMQLFNNNGEPPKILLTTSINAKRNAYEFANVLIEIFPNVTFVKRKFGLTMKDIVDACSKRNFTDIIIINENKKKVTGLSFIHLPDGPSLDRKSVV